MSKSAFIDLTHVSLAYPVPQSFINHIIGQPQSTISVIRDANLDLPLGAHITVFGLTGSGKSTLLRLLAGIIRPTTGRIRINSKRPIESRDIAAGHISVEESEPRYDNVSEILHAFGYTHDVPNLPAKIGAITETLGLTDHLNSSGRTLSTGQRLRLNIARAALSDSPVVLADDVAEQLGVSETLEIFKNLFANRTVITTTRHPQIAEALGLPLILLHQGALHAPATQTEHGSRLSAPIGLDVWIEGLNYSLIRQLKNTPGISVTAVENDQNFNGQRLRLQLNSPRYLPAAYDLLSQTPLIKVEEHPASLNQILARL